MKQSRFTDSQIMAILAQAEAGTAVPKLCSEHGMSSASFYKRRASLDEVQLGAPAELWTYNNERPNMALGGITPRQKPANKYLTDSTAAYC